MKTLVKINQWCLSVIFELLYLASSVFDSLGQCDNVENLIVCLLASLYRCMI